MFRSALRRTVEDAGRLTAAAGRWLAPGRRTMMQKIKDAAAEFLANKRVAVTGVSRHAKDHASNLVYKRFRDRGYEVYPVNADERWPGADSSSRLRAFCLK
jgi:hypothetical protein